MSFGEPSRPPDEEEQSEEELEHGGASHDEEQRQVRAPWHFKFIVVGTVIYLGYRAFQGIEWLIHHV